MMSRSRRRSSDCDSGGRDLSPANRSCKRRRKISEEDMVDYLANKAQKKAIKVAKKLDSKFIWLKKIHLDVSRGVPIEMFSSLKMEKKKQRERLEEIEKLKKRKEERENQRAQHLRRFYGDEREEEEEEEEEDRAILNQNQIDVLEEAIDSRPTPLKDNSIGDELFGFSDEVNLDPCHQKKYLPKYFNRVHTGYAWNKYNRTHYDHDNPPPKTVLGYKFNILYPDLVDKTKAPVYTINKDDGDSTETCIIGFHAGPPYDDIAFRIVNEEWEYSTKKGFKSTFDRGILRVYFNFKKYPYRK